jgi:hypothetical protein
MAVYQQRYVVHGDRRTECSPSPRVVLALIGYVTSPITLLLAPRARDRSIFKAMEGADVYVKERSGTTCFVPRSISRIHDGKVVVTVFNPHDQPCTIKKGIMLCDLEPLAKGEVANNECYY